MSFKPSLPYCCCYYYYYYCYCYYYCKYYCYYCYYYYCPPLLISQLESVTGFSVKFIGDWLDGALDYVW